MASFTSLPGLDARVGLRPSRRARPKAVTRVRAVVGSGCNGELLERRLSSEVVWEGHDARSTSGRSIWVVLPGSVMIKGSALRASDRGGLLRLSFGAVALSGGLAGCAQHRADEGPGVTVGAGVLHGGLD